MARVEKVKEDQREKAMSSVFSLFGTLNTAWNSEKNETAKRNSEAKRSLDTQISQREGKEEFQPHVITIPNISLYLPKDVGEGRYIKGDPLKGYYDFIITEGSYKFWAVFQVTTKGDNVHESLKFPNYNFTPFSY